MDVQLLIMLVLIILVVIALAILSKRRSDQDWAKLSELAAQNGWTLSRGNGQTQATLSGSVQTLATLSGTQDGIPWTMRYQEIRTPGSPDDQGIVRDELSERFIEWRSHSTTLPDGTIRFVPLAYTLLGNPVQPGSPPTEGLSGRLVEWMLSNAGLSVAEATPLLIGSEEFRKEYTAYGPSVEAARSVLIGVESMLAEWPARNPNYLPSIVVDSEAVVIRLNRFSDGFSATEKVGSVLLLERIVQLGVAATKSIQNYA